VVFGQVNHRAPGLARGVSAAPDVIGGDGACRVGAKQVMPGIGAEMRHVDQGHLVRRTQMQDIAGCQRQQTFARAQHRQRAEQAFAIQIDIHVATHHAKRAAAQQKRDAWWRDAVRKARYVWQMFGIDLFDAALLPAMLVALLAGILSFLSPCVLPIVPPYLAYLGGISMGDMRGDEVARRRVILPALFFVLGLSTIFLLLGFTASMLGTFFLTYQAQFAQISGVIVIIFGLHFLGVFRIPLLDREARLDAGTQGGSALGAYVLGLAFAFGWTPCIGPQLGAILSLAAQEGSLTRGTTLLAVYALGLGLPFLLAAIFVERSMGLMMKIKPYMKTIERVMGALLLIVGVALLTGAFTSFSFWLLETFDAVGIPLLG